MRSIPFKIAIVGLGPKGLYGFERILAHLKANPMEEKVEIHLFNKTSFMGSGDVYRSDQPSYLLMNFTNKYINMWSGEAPSPIVEHPLSLSEYLAVNNQISLDEIHPLFSSRATVGAYLENGFTQLCQNLPDNANLHQHISEVRSIEKIGNSYSIGFMQQGASCRLSDFKNILISTGHQRHLKTAQAQGITVPFIYPVKEKLKEVCEKHTVAIKGMGLTFIDAVLALTEGRGGFFNATDNGKLIYKKSGKEPKRIFPFSKSGWPMLPKYEFIDENTDLYVKKIQTLNHKKLSFKNDILPLIVQDMEFAYYSTLFSHEKEILMHHGSYDEINRQIDKFHRKYSKYKQFSLERLMKPEFDSSKSVHQNILDYLTAFTNKKKLDVVHEAELRAASSWRMVSPIFNEIYSFGGLDASSQQEFDHFYFGKLNRIAYGPPPGNLNKILALAEAGIIDFHFAKSPNLVAHKGGYMLKNGISATYCDVLVDARIPKNSMEKDATGLFKNLCENGLALPYINKDEHTIYAVGTVEIDTSGKLINHKGISENITIYGTPTEGIVHDNDTLSRTRNNFATPWAHAVNQQIITSKNEVNKPTTSTLACTK